MADNPDTRPQDATPTPVSDSPHAPFIFYEGAPTMGHTNGVINITLAANRTYIAPDGTATSEWVVTAYLRGNIHAAMSLRAAIDNALLLAAPTPGKSN